MIAGSTLPERIHCVGIGGGGLSALAGLLTERGHRVTGSDSSPSLEDAGLRARGIDVRHGHDPSHLGEAELLIRSAAVPDSNPEVRAARARDVPVLKYSEALGRLMAGRQGIAVGGTHGKTTTTALVAHLLRRCGLDPAWLVGGTPLSLPRAAGWGSGDAMVVEACEYDLSFLNLDYQVAVITGVAPDHLDCFRDEAGVRDAFARFASRVPAGGTLVLGAGVPGTLPLSLQPGVRCWHVQDHLHLDAISEDGQGLSGWVEGGAWGRGEFRLSLLGRHNLENLRVALLTVLACGVPLWFALPHVASFRGVARRLQDLGETSAVPPRDGVRRAGARPAGGTRALGPRVGGSRAAGSRAAGPGAGGAADAVPPGVRIIDDFAHHPDALTAAAAAVRSRFPRRRTVAIFQPHQVSRTEDFLDGFAAALRRFDGAGLCDIFISRDNHPERAEDVAAALADRAGGLPRLGPARNARAGAVMLLQPGDVCVVMGAGDIDGLASQLAGAPARPS